MQPLIPLFRKQISLGIIEPRNIGGSPDPRYFTAFNFLIITQHKTWLEKAKRFDQADLKKSGKFTTQNKASISFFISLIRFLLISKKVLTAKSIEAAYATQTLKWLQEERLGLVSLHYDVSSSHGNQWTFRPTNIFRAILMVLYDMWKSHIKSAPNSFLGRNGESCVHPYVC